MRKQRKQLTAYNDVKPYDEAVVSGVLAFGGYLTHPRPNTGQYNITPHYEVTIGHPKFIAARRNDGTTGTGLVKFLQDRTFTSHSKIFGGKNKPGVEAISLAVKGHKPPLVFGRVTTPANSQGIRADKLLARRDANGKPIMQMNSNTGKQEIATKSLRNGQKISALVRVFQYSGNRVSYTLHGIVVKDVNHLDLYNPNRSVLADYGIKRIPPKKGEVDRVGNTQPAQTPNASQNNNTQSQPEQTSDENINSGTSNQKPQQNNNQSNVKETHPDNPFE